MNATLMMLVLSGTPVRAEEGGDAAPATTTTEPATPPPATVAAPPPQKTEDVREVYDNDGHLVRRLSFLGGVLTQEVVYAYDDDGREITRATDRDGAHQVETWTYDDKGQTLTHRTAVDDVQKELETWTYKDGRVASKAVEHPLGVQTTTWIYDNEGRAVQVETRDQNGQLLARTLSDRQPTPPPKVPIDLELLGGVQTDSDVQTTSVTVGFSIDRKPPATLYGVDHLEVSADASYTLGVSKGERTNDDLSAGFGLDYNDFVARTSAFLFFRVERNPVSNLDVDLEIAPFGIKYDLIPEGGPLTLDASVAPVWDFRSIAVAAGGDCDDVTVDMDSHCTFSKFRASFRARAALELGPAKIKDILEFQPTLNPAGGDLIAGVQEEAIVENTTSLAVKLTGSLALAASLGLTRDPLLAAQADCSADPDNLLCRGLKIESASTLTLDLSF